MSIRQSQEWEIEPLDDDEQEQLRIYGKERVEEGRRKLERFKAWAIEKQKAEAQKLSSLLTLEILEELHETASKTWDDLRIARKAATKMVEFKLMEPCGGWHDDDSCERQLARACDNFKSVKQTLEFAIQIKRGY